MRSVARLLTVWLLGCLLPAAVGHAAGDRPLHERIDQLIVEKSAAITPAEIADDAEFHRRIWLDLAGRIPSAEQTRQFLRDKAPQKRGQLIDRLLQAPTYTERMQDLLHVMLMERRGDDPEWQAFLRNCVERNLPWDAISRAILHPSSEDEQLRGAAFFYTKRLENYGQNLIDFPGLTRDVGRLFLGVDLQCAECHNHLFIDDYKQVDFQGLFAVYRNLRIRKGVTFPAVDEIAVPERLQFVSVFDPTQRETGPRLPFGQEIPLPDVPIPAEKPKKNEKLELPFSALELIANELPVNGNELFTRNIVNRMWFVMMGRGLVEPLDLFHSDNPPSHPELLELLAEEFAAHQFDLKWLLRELALTDTYQRGSAPADDLPPSATFLAATEKRLSAEQLFLSTLQATENLDHFREGGDVEKDREELRSRFIAAYANEPREPETDFNASVKGALFLLNDGQVLELFKPQPGNLVHRLAEIDDPRTVTDELFLSVFSRLPDDEERQAVEAQLQTEPSERAAAIARIAWSMLASMEFFVNH